MAIYEAVMEKLLLLPDFLSIEVKKKRNFNSQTLAVASHPSVLFVNFLPKQYSIHRCPIYLCMDRGFPRNATMKRLM